MFLVRFRIKVNDKSLTAAYFGIFPLSGLRIYCGDDHLSVSYGQGLPAFLVGIEIA